MRDDCIMTNNINADSPAIDIATTAADALYNFPTLADATDYFQSELMIDRDSMINDRAALITALDRDIADLLHNCNLSDLIPDADDLDESAYDALADRFDDDNILAMIADHILARIATN